jgi:hypothetical protein
MTYRKSYQLDITCTWQIKLEPSSELARHHMHVSPPWSGFGTACRYTAMAAGLESGFVSTSTTSGSRKYCSTVLFRDLHHLLARRAHHRTLSLTTDKDQALLTMATTANAANTILSGASFLCYLHLPRDLFFQQVPKPSIALPSSSAIVPLYSVLLLPLKLWPCVEQGQSHRTQLKSNQPGHVATTTEGR